MIALLLYAFVMFAIPLLLLLALPILAAIGLNCSGYAWHISLLPLLVPMAALASEAFPKWRVEALARAPLENINLDPVTSVYLSYGTAEDAAQLVVQHPDLGFAESVLDLNSLHSPTPHTYSSSWRRIPSGLVRFHGSRPVKSKGDCRPDEIDVWITGAEAYTRIHGYCTRWASIQRLGAAYELKRVIQRNRIGPYVVDQEIDEVVRRKDGQNIRSDVWASITGGIVQHIMLALDSWPGNSDRAKYHASTLGNIDTVCREKFLLTGKLPSGTADSKCQLR